MALRSWFTDRRALAELRGLRRAAERIADALELQAGQAPRPGGQSFRGFSRARAGAVDESGVSYADPQVMARADAVANELHALLGRDPTPEELERGMRGDVE